MVADDLKELHAFAEKIGLKRHWFEGVRKGHPHYDVTNPEAWNLAVANGAQLVDSRTILIKSKKLLR